VLLDFILLSRVSTHTHAERDILMAPLSVCPSHSGMVPKRMHIFIVERFPHSGSGMTSFWSVYVYRFYKIPR